MATPSKDCLGCWDPQGQCDECPLALWCMDVTADRLAQQAAPWIDPEPARRRLERWQRNPGVSVPIVVQR